jgi:hypothetical protein
MSFQGAIVSADKKAKDDVERGAEKGRRVCEKERGRTEEAIGGFSYVRTYLNAIVPQYTSTIENKVSDLY